MGEGLHKGILFQIMSLMLFLAFLTLLHSISPVRSEGNLLVVSNDELADFQTIQEAVNAAASGDQIYVKAGIYFEHVMVNKTVFLIGENPSNTVIDGSNNGDAVTVTADNVSMTQLTLQNGYCGVTATEAHGMICTNNVVKNNIFGIYLRQCSTISFADNLIEHNQHGIWFVHLRQCYMRRNNFMSNSFNFEPEVIDIDYYALEEYVHDIDMSNSVDGKPIYYIVNEQDIEVPSNAGFVAIVNSSQIVAENLNLRNNAMGVFLVNTNDSLIRNVRVGDSENAGIALTHSERNLILNNVIDNCSWGIVPWEWTVDNTISNNTLRGNDFFGVVLHGSECIRNRVSDNFFVDNSFGVHLGGDCYYNIVERNLLENNTIGLSTDLNRENTFRENTVVGSDRGFYLYYTQDNCIYRNNFINNREQVFVQEFAKDSWDNGYEGNYWSDYNGTDIHSGPYQNETGSDGMGDTQYDIETTGSQDRYPLMNPRIPQHDLAIATFHPSKTAVGQGFPMSVAFSVQNEGDYFESVNISLTFPTFVRIVVIASECCLDFNITWNTTGVAMGNYTISACVSIVLWETDVGDNNFTGVMCITIAGDLSGDFKVGPYDFALLAVAYGSTPSKPKWNPNCDINSDGKVGPADFAQLSAHYGQHYP